jgi:hypothetical protein
MEFCVLDSSVMSLDIPVDFSGTIVRFEPDGFGIVHFDIPIGPNANTYGIISSSTHTGTVTGPYVYIELKPGMRVVGTANPDKRDVARIKTVKVI